jgi:vacuolar-type H+-ATPase subunit E/Vma4
MKLFSNHLRIIQNFKMESLKEMMSTLEQLLKNFVCSLKNALVLVPYLKDKYKLKVVSMESQLRKTKG